MSSLAPPLLLSLCLLAGCATVGPDHVAPDAATLQAGGEFLAASEVEGRRTLRPAPELTTWWRGFDDPALSRIVERAATDNLDIAGARARLEQAAAAAGLARAQQLPAGEAQGRAVVQRRSLEAGDSQLAQAFPGFDRTVESYALGAAATWELDLFGGLRRGREAATADAEAAAAAVQGARVTVIGEAADSYLQVRQIQRRQAILREQIAVAERLHDLVALRFREGVAAEQETRRTAAQLAQFRAGLPLLDAALTVQLNRLDVLMGAAPGAYRAELLPVQPIPSAPTIAATGPADLLRRRPDLLAAERRLAARSARIGEAVADYYPKVSLGGLLGLDALDLGRLATGDAATASGVLGLRWRLFDFGRVDAAVAAARGAEREALAGYRQSVLRALEDVENAFTALVRREAQARELAEAETALVAARASVAAAYDAGAVSLLEVLDVERQLLSAQDQHAQAQGEAGRAAVAAFRALGGGWS